MTTKQVKYVEVSPEDALDINAINAATCEALKRQSNISINPERLVSTIAHAFLRQTILHAKANAEPGTQTEINLFNLVTLGISIEDVDAEKDGNIVPYLEPGQEMKLLVKSDGDTED